MQGGRKWAARNERAEKPKAMKEPGKDGEREKERRSKIVSRRSSCRGFRFSADLENRRKAGLLRFANEEKRAEEETVAENGVRRRFLFFARDTGVYTPPDKSTLSCPVPRTRCWKRIVSTREDDEYRVDRALVDVRSNCFARPRVATRSQPVLITFSRNARSYATARYSPRSAYN